MLGFPAALWRGVDGFIVYNTGLLDSQHKQWYQKSINITNVLQSWSYQHKLIL